LTDNELNVVADIDIDKIPQYVTECHKAGLTFEAEKQGVQICLLREAEKTINDLGRLPLGEKSGVHHKGVTIPKFGNF
jgi:hypothetical protein